MRGVFQIALGAGVGVGTFFLGRQAFKVWKKGKDAKMWVKIVWTAGTLVSGLIAWRLISSGVSIASQPKEVYDANTGTAVITSKAAAGRQSRKAARRIARSNRSIDRKLSRGTLTQAQADSIRVA